MLFGKIKQNSKVQVMIGNVVTERVCESKLLGVILDHKICWKLQISHVRAKVAKCIAVSGKTQHES